MHSPDDRPISPTDQAYGIARAKQLVAASRDPKSKLLLARQIFTDAFSEEVPERGAVKSSRGQGMKGHARRDKVPDMPPPPMQYPNNDAATELAQAEHGNKILARLAVIAENERKLRALLWARNVFLEQGDPEGFGDALESAVREWFLCTLHDLPRDTAGIEACARANARASWATLKRIAIERTQQAAE